MTRDDFKQIAGVLEGAEQHAGCTWHLGPGDAKQVAEVIRWGSMDVAYRQERRAELDAELDHLAERAWKREYVAAERERKEMRRASWWVYSWLAVLMSNDLAGWLGGLALSAFAGGGP